MIFPVPGRIAVDKTVLKTVLSWFTGSTAQSYFPNSLGFGVWALYRGAVRRGSAASFPLFSLFFFSQDAGFTAAFYEYRIYIQAL
jgi:hypothetical protein